MAYSFKKNIMSETTSTEINEQDDGGRTYTEAEVDEILLNDKLRRSKLRTLLTIAGGLAAIAAVTVVTQERAEVKKLDTISGETAAWVESLIDCEEGREYWETHQNVEMINLPELVNGDLADEVSRVHHAALAATMCHRPDAFADLE